MLTEEQNTFLFPRWISSWPGEQIRKLNISHLVILAWGGGWRIWSSFLLSWVPYNMLKHHSSFNYFWNSNITQSNGTVTLMHLKFSNILCHSLALLESKTVLTDIDLVCLQDSERRLDHLFSFSSPLFSIWIFPYAFHRITQPQNRQMVVVGKDLWRSSRDRLHNLSGQLLQCSATLKVSNFLFIFT